LNLFANLDYRVAKGLFEKIMQILVDYNFSDIFK